MGYTTNFTGELKFNRELKASEIVLFKKYFGEDFRKHPEWNNSGKELYYIDVDFNKDYTGLIHNESEKTYDFDTIINTLMSNINKQIPDLKLTGEISAQGEDVDDRWILRMINGIATRINIEIKGIKGIKITCPHCEGSFIYEIES